MVLHSEPLLLIVIPTWYSESLLLIVIPKWYYIKNQSKTKIVSALTVLIVCPTGALVCSMKDWLPEFDGVERIHVDTIHSVLKSSCRLLASGSMKLFSVTRGRSMTIWNGSACTRRSESSHIRRMSLSSLISNSFDL